MAVSSDFLIVEPPAAGLQRLRAGFSGHAYDRHRHETYAVGVTEAGFNASVKTRRGRHSGAPCCQEWPRRTMRPSRRDRWFADSPLEQRGFELPVPRAVKEDA